MCAKPRVNNAVSAMTACKTLVNNSSVEHTLPHIALKHNQQQHKQRDRDRQIAGSYSSADCCLAEGVVRRYYYLLFVNRGRVELNNQTRKASISSVGGGCCYT